MIATNKVKLSEISTLISKGSTPRGKVNYSKTEKNDFLRVTDMADYGRVKKSDLTLSDEDFAKNKMRLWPVDTVLISIEGTIGKVSILKKVMAFNQAVAGVVVDKTKILPEYLMYYLKSESAFGRIVKGTIMPAIRLGDISNLDIDLPSLNNQKKIVDTLEKIDLKIGCNNRTNDNLHEMCLTIYRDLINKADAEKDLLKNHAKCVLGGTPSRAKPEYWNGNINWINSGEINRFRILEPSETITDLGLKKTSTTLLPIGTTVLAITGATLGQVSRLEIESCANQSVIGVIPDDSLTNEFVYLNILENINDIIGRQTGGAQQHINKNDVETYEIIIPEPEKIAKFDKEIKPIFGQIRNNCLENERLTKLRDTLLPELLNGKIDISNIDI